MKKPTKLEMIERLMELLGGYADFGAAINEKMMNEFLKSLSSDNGFKDYFRYRDLQILKTMANGLDDKQYWMNVGRRAELLYMVGKSTEILKREKAEEEKAKNKK